MRLEGIHHITAITGDAPRQRRLLHARPRPAAGQEERQPGRPDRLPPLLRRRARQRRVGPDVLRVPGRPARPPGARDGAPDRVARRPPRTRCRSGPSGSRARASQVGRPGPGLLRFADPEGLEHELAVDASGDEPLIAEHPEVPAEHALRGFAGVRAYAHDAEPAARCSSRRSPSSRRATAGRSAASGAAAPTPTTRRRTSPASRAPAPCTTSPGRRRRPSRRRGASAVLRAGGRPTPVIDRFYFRSVYFREPSGVLFEIATIGPGFTTDEPAESLGQKLALPPDYEHLRAQIEATVTPLPPTRPARRTALARRGERVLRGVLAVLRRAVGRVGDRRRARAATPGRPRRRPRARRARRRAPAPRPRRGGSPARACRARRPGGISARRRSSRAP